MNFSKKKNHSQFNKNNEKEIYEFIEKISDSYISSIKEKILIINPIKFQKENFNLTEIKSDENISFDYIKEFDKTLFDGTIINFSKFNSLPKESLFRIKIFFIKEKLLIIFRNNEQNNIYAQIGMMKESEKHYIFNIDYLIAFKTNKIDKNNQYSILDCVLNDEKEIDIFY